MSMCMHAHVRASLCECVQYLHKYIYLNNKSAFTLPKIVNVQTTLSIALLCYSHLAMEFVISKSINMSLS